MLKIVFLSVVLLAGAETSPTVHVDSRKYHYMAGLVWDAPKPIVREAGPVPGFMKVSASLAVQTFVSATLAKPQYNADGGVLTMVEVEESNYRLLYVNEGNARKCLGVGWDLDRPNTNYCVKLEQNLKQVHDGLGFVSGVAPSAGFLLVDVSKDPFYLVRDGYMAMESVSGEMGLGYLDGPTLRQSVCMTSSGAGVVRFEIVGDQGDKCPREHVEYSFTLHDGVVVVGKSRVPGKCAYSTAVVNQDSDLVFFVRYDNLEKSIVFKRDKLEEMLSVVKMYDSVIREGNKRLERVSSIVNDGH